jgi:gamma-glutamyl hydrolase
MGRLVWHFFIFSALWAFGTCLNLRPIVGVITQPTGGALAQFGSSQLNADYVKWLESAGARVVPVPFDAPQSELHDLFSYINGLVFPGGADIINHTQYSSTATLLWNWAKQANDAGDYFPVHGTCLGFELEGVIVNGGDVSILSAVDAENVSLVLDFVSGYESRLFSLVQQSDMSALSSNPPLTENYHHWGIDYAETFLNPDLPLSSFFSAISTSTDRQGKIFVSGWEAKQYPFYGLQWHPERSLFEWAATEDINHSGVAVRIMEALAEFVVSEARKSNHRFPDAETEQESLIYNWIPKFTGQPPLLIDEQMYLFTTRPLE